MFDSDATNLNSWTVNGDVFLHDRQTGLTSLVSLGSAGFGNDISYQARISSDGTHVCFASAASNLVGGDTNGLDDVFVRDLSIGVTTRVSVSSVGAQALGGSSTWPSVSGDGRFIAFASDASNLVSGDANFSTDVFLHDALTGATSLVSTNSLGVQGDSQSATPAISSDGRYVAFRSYSTNFVAGDTNGAIDVFVKDLVSGTTTLVSSDPLGIPGNAASLGPPSISADGRVIVFESDASNLVTSDTNAAPDVFLRDMQTGVVTRVSVDSSGLQGNGYSQGGVVDAIGRFVAFESFASNLVPGDTNVGFDAFVRDTVTGLTTRVNVSSDGNQAIGPILGGTHPSGLSSNGRFVVMSSNATNLVAGDTNGKWDVFVRDRECSAPSVYCTAKTNSLGCVPTIATSGTPSMSAGSGFTLSVSQVLNNKSGLFFYGLTGQQGAPFQGGTLCVRLPVTRTPVQASGGNPPPNDCSGNYSFDFNLWIAGGGDPLLVTGTTVDVQCWARDPGFSAPNNTSLSAAVHFGICP